MRVVYANPRPLLMLLALALLLPACGTVSRQSEQTCPNLPPAPALSEPISPQSYSDNVRLLLQTWAQKLTGSTPTGAP